MLTTMYHLSPYTVSTILLTIPLPGFSILVTYLCYNWKFVAVYPLSLFLAPPVCSPRVPPFGPYVNGIIKCMYSFISFFLTQYYDYEIHPYCCK